MSPELFATLSGSRRALKRWATQPQYVDQPDIASSLIAAAMSAYWDAIQWSTYRRPMPPIPVTIELSPVDLAILTQAYDYGRLAARLEPLEAAHQLGALYTLVVPTAQRAQHGIYYTPPVLTRRLIDLATAAGVDWARCRIADPACGAGALLIAAVQMIADACTPCTADELLDHISQHVYGFELDPVAAWMTQVLLEATLLDQLNATGRRLAVLVTVGDTLLQPLPAQGFDLVIGNPPYGRLRLPVELRRRYARSLYGHANLYGVFTDLALHWTRPGGVIAYVTPTSFLGGQYFKALRSLLSREAPPYAIDLVRDRKDVFADVLQETLLATYVRGGQTRSVPVHVIGITDTATSRDAAGAFTLPREQGGPWMLPRTVEQAPLVARLRLMPHHLWDYGYRVSTGPLVWNRHKPQLSVEHAPGSLPVIWAECVTPDGRFVYRAQKKNHAPFFRPTIGDDWLICHDPCVLVQRTTAKEQRRRLIAAALPSDFIQAHGAVVVENHLNMVRPMHGCPGVDIETLAVLLNSTIVDTVFRCINGSVAVSASELEAMPLPAPDDMQHLAALVHADASPDILEQAILEMYLPGVTI